MTTATDKIIIVSGQEFRVPATTDNEAIRTHLKPNFPDVGNATIQTGTRTIDGVAYETIEFVKKAGTKGTDVVLVAKHIQNGEIVVVATALMDFSAATMKLAEIKTFPGQVSPGDRDPEGELWFEIEDKSGDLLADPVCFTSNYAHATLVRTGIDKHRAQVLLSGELETNDATV